MREKWIDNAKGLAILLVIIGHTTGKLENTINFYFVYGIHLVMFYLVSGYTLKIKKVDSAYIQDRFKRLIFPYLTTCMVMLVIGVFTNAYMNKDHSLSGATTEMVMRLLKTFFASGYNKTMGGVDMGGIAGAIWFLPAMFFAVIITQLVLNKTDDKRAGIILGLVAAIGYLSARFIWLPFSIQAGMFSAVFIWMGYEIKKYELLKSVKWYMYIAALAIWLFGVIKHYSGIGYVYAYANDVLIGTLVGLSGCLLMYGISRLDTKGKVLEFCGKNSLLILCIHTVALETLGTYVNKILNHTGLTGNSRVWLYTAIEFAIAILGALFITALKKINKSADNGLLSAEHSFNNTLLVIALLYIISSLGGASGFNALSQSVVVAAMAMIIASDSKSIKLTICTGILCLCSAIEVKVFGYDGKLLMRNLLYLSGAGAIHELIKRYIKSDLKRFFIAFLISIFGITLAKERLHLLARAEGIFFVVIFYEIGYLLTKNNAWKSLEKNLCHIFILSSMWVYMIYKGSMNIATGDYGFQYGISVCGAVAGALCIYQLMSIFDNSLIRVLSRASYLVLIIFVIFAEPVKRLIGMRFTNGQLPFVMIFLAVVFVPSLIISFVLNKFEKN